MLTLWEVSSYVREFTAKINEVIMDQYMNNRIWSHESAIFYAVRSNGVLRMHTHRNLGTDWRTTRASLSCYNELSNELWARHTRHQVMAMVTDSTEVWKVNQTGIYNSQQQQHSHKTQGFLILDPLNCSWGRV